MDNVQPPPIREKIFSNEFSSITRDVLSHDSEATPVKTVAYEEIRDALDRAFELKIPAAQDLTGAIRLFYSHEENYEKALLAILIQMREMTGASALAALLYDTVCVAYRSFLDTGLDFLTRKNLYFALHDKFLNPEELIQIFNFDSNLKDDFHFRKKFSTEFFSAHAGSALVNLSSWGLAGYLIFFFEEKEQLRFPVPDSVHEIITDIIPGLNRLQIKSKFAGETSLHNRDNPTWIMLQNMKQFSDSGKDEFTVMHVRIGNLHKHNSPSGIFDVILEAVRRKLQPRERILRVSFDRLVALLLPSDTQALKEFLEQTADGLGLETHFKTLQYPGNGRNLFNYLIV